MVDFATVNFIASGRDSDISSFAQRALTERDGRVELDFDKIVPKPAVLRGLDRGDFDLRFSAYEVEVALQALLRKPIPGRFGVGTDVDSLAGDAARKLMLKTYDDLERWVRQHLPGALDRAAKSQGAHAATGYYFEEDWESDCWGGDAGRMVFAMAELTGNRYRARFSFPWSAPRPIFYAIARDHPSLVIRAGAYEPSYKYNYVMNAAKGAVTEDWPAPSDAG